MTGKEVEHQREQWQELTPSQVALRLSKMSRELQERANEQRPLEDAAVEAREAYTLAYAKRFLQEDGNNEERKQRTLEMTSELRLAADLAGVLVKMHIQQINTLRKRIDVARSAAALVRAEAELMSVRGSSR